MTNPRHFWLMALGVASVVATASSAGAQMRTASDASKRVRTAASSPRVAHAPAEPRRSAPADHAVYSREIAAASARYEVPERLIRAVIRVESGFDHRAVSARGARGLMQLMPETAAILGVRNAFDPRENIDGGTRHLRAMMVRFRHDVRLAVAAYNAGEKPVAAYGGVPPYPETRQYVAQVLRLYDASLEGGAIDWERLPASGVHRFVEPDGTVVYTNIRYGQLTVAANRR